MLEATDDLNLPILSPLSRRWWWVLREDWEMYGITIPKGFSCDLDSIPHVPILFTVFKGRARKSALLHDYLYMSGIYSRSLSDSYFYKAMLDEGVPTWMAKSMYYAVRLFGRRFYLNDYKGQVSDTPIERINRFKVDRSGDVSVFNTSE